VATTTTSAVPEQESNFTNTVVHGDCAQVMRQIPAQNVDFILTDPPYLLNFRDRCGRSIANDRDASWLKPAFAETYRILRSDSFMVCCYGWSKVDLFFAAWREAGFVPLVISCSVRPMRPRPISCAISTNRRFCWPKAGPKRPISPISDVQEFRYSKNELHPTQKPVSALIPLIKSFSRESDLAVDPFCGSASTCAAALLVGHRFLGIEMDEKYFRIATARMARVSERIAVTQGSPESKFHLIRAAPNDKGRSQNWKECPHGRIFLQMPREGVWEGESRSGIPPRFSVLVGLPCFRRNRPTPWERPRRNTFRGLSGFLGRHPTAGKHGSLVPRQCGLDVIAVNLDSFVVTHDANHT
jgi:site-specific DNA-methyltransferase (adenine-specific)